MELLWQDEALVVCLKPPGVISEAGEKEPNMPALIAAQCGREPITVHRLDKETAGIMVYAFTKASAAALSEQIRAGEFKKEYLAVCSGTWDAPAGEMRDYLYHDTQKNKSFLVKKERPGVKEALLDYTVLEENKGMSLVRVKLHTGRTHQIRVQFAGRKHPLYGDRKYGGPGGQTALFACSLSFVHPVTGEKTVWQASPPSGFPWSLFGGKTE